MVQAVELEEGQLRQKSTWQVKHFSPEDSTTGLKGGRQVRQDPSALQVSQGGEHREHVLLTRLKVPAHSAQVSLALHLAQLSMAQVMQMEELPFWVRMRPSWHSEQALFCWHLLHPSMLH